jgi:hypothetical protein
MMSAGADAGVANSAISWLIPSFSSRGLAPEISAELGMPARRRAEVAILGKEQNLAVIVLGGVQDSQPDDDIPGAAAFPVAPFRAGRPETADLPDQRLVFCAPGRRQNREDVLDRPPTGLHGVRRIQVRNLSRDVLLELPGQLPRGLLQRVQGILDLILKKTEVLIQNHLRDREHLATGLPELTQKAQQRTVGRRSLAELVRVKDDHEESSAEVYHRSA